ncbi:response regulator [Patescibacteria group bacterium]|nr:response regulator [Patescibacteria group bacterium]
MTLELQPHNEIDPLLGTGVLIVDDEKPITNIFGIFLKRFSNKNKLGLNVLTANSVEDALNILRTTKIDLLITDYQINGMTGAQLIARIKEEQLGPMKTLMISGSFGSDSDKEAREYGADAGLSKPINDFPGLFNKIRGLFEDSLPPAT